MGRGGFAVIAAAALGLLVAGAALAGVMQGTVRNDTLKGTASTDVVLGKGGNDKLYGLAGNDKLDGDSGNDRIDGGAGNDTVYGGAGDDKLVGGAGNDTLVGGTGKDRFDCGPGRDSVSASAIDVVGSGCAIYNGWPVDVDPGAATDADPDTGPGPAQMALPGLSSGFADQGPGICLTVTADSKGVTAFHGSRRSSIAARLRRPRSRRSLDAVAPIAADLCVQATTSPAHSSSSNPATTNIQLDYAISGRVHAGRRRHGHDGARLDLLGRERHSLRVLRRRLRLERAASVVTRLASAGGGFG